MGGAFSGLCSFGFLFDGRGHCHYLWGSFPVSVTATAIITEVIPPGLSSCIATGAGNVAHV